MRALLVLLIAWPAVAAEAPVRVTATLLPSVTLEWVDGMARARVAGTARSDVSATVAVTDDSGVAVIDVAASADEWVAYDPGLAAEVRAVADLRAREDADVVRDTLRRGRKR